MKILATGGSGSIGRNVVNDLKKDHEVRVFDIVAPPVDDCEFVKGDVGNLEDLGKAMTDIDAVIHLAGGLPSTPYEIVNLNAMGTFNVLECMVSHKIERLVYASSDAAFGLVFRRKHFHPESFPVNEEMRPRPQDPYGLAKLMSEKMCRGYTEGHGIRTICLRHCWVWWKCYQERENIASKAEDGRERWINIGRMWGYVDMSDVVRAYRLALEKIDEVEHEIFFLSAEDTFTEEKSIDLIKEYFPQTKDISEEYQIKPYKSLHGIEKARRVLGWEPKVSWRKME